MFQFKRYFVLVGVFALSLLLLVACGAGEDGTPTSAADSQPPTAIILQPANQAVLPPGQATAVEVVANDNQAVARIELYVDNSLIESRVAPEGSALTTMSETFVWSASMIGPHTLQARVYDAAGQLGASSIVSVNVGEGQAATTAAPGATSPPAEATPIPTEPAEPAATATPEQALVTASVNANVRGGPGLNYYVVGSLNEGQSAVVTGRNADSSWWQINHQGSTAWIANSVVTANAQAANAPVASAPPPPPTSTPVPPTATAAPTATSAPTTGFWAEQTSVSASQCTTLHWNLTSIKAVYISFGFGYDKQGVAGQGSQQICPSVTTNYEALIVKPDNSQETRTVTVNVGGSGCGDPIIRQFAPTTYEVPAGKPFSIFWDVECAKSVRFVRVGGAEEPVTGKGSKIDVTVQDDTTFQLKVEKTGGGYVYASFKINAK